MAISPVWPVRALRASIAAFSRPLARPEEEAINELRVDEGSFRGTHGRR
ncbi:hypothetical protein [Micromonospora palomenae]|nr:hypothetical protein [Micromonospora palomenae]